MDVTDSIVAQIRACRGDWEMVSHLLPLGFSAGCHAVSKKSQEAFTARTRHPSGQIVTIRGTLPAPGVFQPSCNRVCVARAERARMVCRVRYESALDGLLWASSGITFHYRIVCACLLDHISLSSCVSWGGGAPPHLMAFLAGLWLVTVGNSVVMAGIGVVTG